jgi:hypothetical protein
MTQAPAIQSPRRGDRANIAEYAPFFTAMFLWFATQPSTGSESCHIGHRSYGGVQLGRYESGCDERPDVRIRHRSI